MPRIERSAEVVWEGNVARGSGRITGATGAFTDLPYSLPTRVGKPDGKTSPEELLAAAHGGCLTMSVASELSQAGTPPARIETTCQIMMDEVEGEGHQIVGSNVTIAVDADGASDDGIATALELADAGCPFSTLLRKAGVQVTITRA
jgi:osmotically inducible protein OsmC